MNNSLSSITQGMRNNIVDFGPGGVSLQWEKIHNWRALGRIKPISKERERAQLAAQLVIVIFKPFS
jgi:hypothetical protein